MRLFLIFSILISSCKKQPNNFSELEPYIGRYKSVQWANVPDVEIVPEHIIEVTRSGMFKLKAKGSPYNYKGRIESIDQQDNVNYDTYFVVKLLNESFSTGLGFNSDTLYHSIWPSQIDKYESAFYFVKQ